MLSLNSDIDKSESDLDRLQVIQGFRERHIILLTRLAFSRFVYLMSFSVRTGMPRHGQKGGQKAESALKKPRLTHFLCVPLINRGSRPQLETSIQSFRDDVCQTTDNPFKASTITEKAIRPVGAIHLTLGVMSLDPERLVKATEALDQINVADLLYEAMELNTHQALTDEDDSPLQPSTVPIKPALESLTRPVSPPPTSETPKPITISLKSLVSMHPPHKTSILYTAPDDPSNRLHALCSILRARFQGADFLIEDKRPLKLHATLVNTIYAKGRKPRGYGPQRQDRIPVSSGDRGGNAEEEQEDRSQGHGPDAKAPLIINATDILDRYADFVWAEDVELDRIAICEMGAKKVLNDMGEVVNEEYKEVAVLRLPTSSR